MRETFKKIVSGDLYPILPKINAPTLLIWGEKDSLVRASLGKKISTAIPNCRFLILRSQTHRLPYESPRTFSRAVLTFLS